MNLARWVLTAEEQESYIDAMTEELVPLRVRLGISQTDLCNIIGISRQTLSAIEGRKKKMSWAMYLALVMIFDANYSTREAFRKSAAYPAALINRMNEGKKPDASSADLGELGDIIRELDDQAIHTLKTMLLVEYARCKQIPGELVVKAFDGMNLRNAAKDEAAEIALKNIRKR